MGDILKMEDIYKRWTEYLKNTWSRVNHPPPINCDSWWGQELHLYNQYEEERTPTLESVFTKFTSYHATSTGNQNSMQNQEIQVGKSYSMENYQWEQELQPYNQYEEERTFNLDNLLMQYKEVTESTQWTFKSLEIQVGKLTEEVTKFMARREEKLCRDWSLGGKPCRIAWLKRKRWREKWGENTIMRKVLTNKNSTRKIIKSYILDKEDMLGPNNITMLW